MAAAIIAAAAILTGLGVTVPIVESNRRKNDETVQKEKAAAAAQQTIRKPLPLPPPPLVEKKKLEPVLLPLEPECEELLSPCDDFDFPPIANQPSLCQPMTQTEQLQTVWRESDCNNTFSQQPFNKKDTDLMSQLPPHLRSYVDPDYVAPPPAACPPPRASSGIKSYYDYRNREPTQLQRLNVEDQPRAKLTRTFGNDEKVIGVQGNTVFHPTVPALARPYPVTGRESDNFIRRMTGFDKNPQKKAPVLNPTLIPDGPEGTVPGGGRFLTDRERDAYVNLNPNNIGDQFLPFIPVDIRQWQEKPVSYKKPSQLVREPLLPDSRAGRYTVPNDIGLRQLGESSLPTTIGSGDGCGILVDADRYDVDIKHMPREPTHQSFLKQSILEEPERPLCADEELPIPKGSEPKTYTLIKTDNKKLQQPHSLAYGANYAASDEADYDPTANGTYSADLSKDRLRERASRVASGIQHGAANGDMEVGQSVLPTIGNQAADGQKRVALREMNAHSSILPGRENDDGVASAADGTLVGSRARQGRDARRIEHVPLEQTYRAQNEDNVEAGSHADRVGGVSARRPQQERPIQSCNVLDDLAYDASGRQQEGVFVRTDDETRKRRIDVREAKQQQINVLQNYNIGDAIGDGQGIDSASFNNSTEARGVQRGVNARIRERNFAPSEHGAANMNGYNNDDQAVGDNYATRVGGDPHGMREGKVREQRRLETVDLARRTGETGGVEIERSVMGTSTHRDVERVGAIAARERYLAPTLRADDPMFEDATSSVHRAAAARTGDSVVRAEQFGQRRAAMQSEAAAQAARRVTLTDENYSQSDIAAPTTSVRRPALARERAKTETRTDYRFDGCDNDQAVNPTTSARALDDAARAKRRELAATYAPRQTGTLTSDDMIDAPNQPTGTDAWRDTSRAVVRESARQRRREDLWRAVLENEDGDGVADHTDAAGRVRARGDGKEGEQRLDARGTGRYDGIVEAAENDFVKTGSLDIRGAERAEKPGRAERTRGLDAHRISVESLGGDGQGIADSSAVTMSVSAGLRDLFTKHRETTRSNPGVFRGGDDVDSVYEADRFAEKVNTQQQRRDRSFRDETIIQRFGNPDSDVLDNPVMAGNGVGMKPDQRVGRMLLREQEGLCKPTKGRIDDIEDKFVTYTLDPGTVRSEKPMVGVKEERRAAALQARLRCDSPPPDNILKTNARFRAMTSGGRFSRNGPRPQTPGPQGSAAPRRSDSPIYRGTQVCPF